MLLIIALLYPEAESSFRWSKSFALFLFLFAALTDWLDGWLARRFGQVSDFGYEFQMAQMNRHLDPELETIFLMPNEKYFFTSSQLIKQVHLYGVKETGLVPENVFHALQSLSGLRDT